MEKVERRKFWVQNDLDNMIDTRAGGIAKDEDQLGIKQEKM